MDPQNFESYAARGLVLARVISSHRDQYRLAASGADLPVRPAIEFDAEPSGALWHRAPTRANMPVVGDWVAARIVGDSQAIVEAVLPRRTLFSRRAAGRREDQQPIAANVDLVFLVCGLDGDFNLRRLERYLALAVESGAQPVVVLNKADVCADLPSRIAETSAIAAGAPVVPASTRAPGGLDALRVHIAPGLTIALLGSSGVGKSSIVNALVGDERLRTNEVRESDSRGRHTTTHRELIPLPGGAALIDTPGMRELQLWASRDTIEVVFDEIAAVAANCRYSDCAHAGEPDCAVEAALADGTLTADRLTSYRKLQGEAHRHELLADPIAAQERKRKWKVIHKAMRHHKQRP